MKKLLSRALLLVMLIAPMAAFAQTAVTANPDHQKMLLGSTWYETANKRLVYDFWRTVFEAGQVQYAPMYMDKNYIQHNPNVANGRDAFIAFLTAFVKPTPVQRGCDCPWSPSPPMAIWSPWCRCAPYPTPISPAPRTPPPGSTCSGSRRA